MAFTLHLTTSFLALGIGAVVLFLSKGTLIHKTLGSVWVLSMLLSAVSSFWLGGGVLPVLGHLGPIHLLSVWVLVSLAAALSAIVKGRGAGSRRSWACGDAGRTLFISLGGRLKTLQSGSQSLPGL